jgi:hypothetical protein
MLLALDFINKKKMLSVLICSKSLSTYYSRFNWKKISKFDINVKSKNLKGLNVFYFQNKKKDLLLFNKSSQINLFINN